LGALLRYSAQGNERGLPIGTSAGRILAEASLIAVDEELAKGRTRFLALCRRLPDTGGRPAAGSRRAHGSGGSAGGARPLSEPAEDPHHPDQCRDRGKGAG